MYLESVNMLLFRLRFAMYKSENATHVSQDKDLHYHAMWVLLSRV